jgi:Cu+-exporting ATPase
VAPAEGFLADDVLRMAASLDQGSEHPLAEAIVAEARKRGLTLESARTSNRRPASACAAASAARTLRWATPR